MCDSFYIEKTCVIWKYALPSSVIHYHCNHHRHTSSSPLSPAFFVITVIFRYVFGGFGMLLVSEDFSSMIVWTILYYTRYVGKLSTRSLSYLWPDLPLLLENNTTVVVSGCRPLARGLRSNVIKLRYACKLVCTYTLTYICRSIVAFCVGAFINVFNQIHYRWCHKNDAASTWLW